jgi:acyl dehydratase
VDATTHRPLTRADLDPLGQSPIHLDALVAEEDGVFVFEKHVTMDDPGVREQRATSAWPHHLPGELVIGLTGQAGTIALRRAGLIDDGWRGHGVRIRDARFSKAVLVGETVFVRAEIVRTRRLGRSIHVSFRFRMWKCEHGTDVETYRSEQDAIFFPGA